MDKELIKLPLLIGGEEIFSDDYIQFEYDDLIINYPVVNDDIRKKILQTEPTLLRNLKLEELTEFLHKVSELWIDENYYLRKQLIEYGSRITRQSRETVKHNLAVILQLISFKEFMEDVVDYEMGNKKILDDWIQNGNAEIHAEPLGRLLHVVSGNVGLAGLYSIVRGILTKNVNVVKMSQKDLLTPYLFIKSFSDVDPEHPVTKAMSAVYWNKDDFVNIDFFCNCSNGIVAWGGYETIKTYKCRCPVGCEFIEYGPKRGIQIIDYTKNTDRILELNIARDISVLDQEACLSPQILFIKGEDLNMFYMRLAKGLSMYNNLWPAAKHSVDHYIHMNYVYKSHQFLGNFAWPGLNREWMIVKCDDLNEVMLDHPLGRTIFIKEVNDFEECMEYIDNTVQTVGIAPKSLAYELRDRLVEKGVTRIANIGFVEMPREGLFHEGVSLSRLVKIVGMDLDESYNIKTYDIPKGYFKQFVYSLKGKKKVNK